MTSRDRRQIDQDCGAVLFSFIRIRNICALLLLLLLNVVVSLYIIIVVVPGPRTFDLAADVLRYFIKFFVSPAREHHSRI